VEQLGSNVAVESYTIPDLVGMVARSEFVIPDFQRDMVWRTRQVADLWDSVYRGFPIGSLLYWHTEERLASLRSIGGFDLNVGDTQRRNHGVWRYVLDGQQRLTALFIAMRGGAKRVHDDPNVNYALYFDPTADEIPSTTRRDDLAGEDDDERVYATRFFLFERDLERRRKELRAAGISSDLIIRVANASAASLERRQQLAALPGCTPSMALRLERLNQTLTEYHIPVVRVGGASLRDVCAIYERVNQAGKPLSVVDLVVARTFRESDDGAMPGFNLRRGVDAIKRIATKRAPEWASLDERTLLNMIAFCLRVEQDRGSIPSRPRIGIDRDALLTIGASDIAPHWERLRDAITRTISFLIAQGIYKPDLLPSDYLALPICAHLLDHQPGAAEWAYISRWFWRNAFDHPSIRDQSSADRAMRDAFMPLRQGATPGIEPLTLREEDLVRAQNANSALYHAVVAFLSHIGPRDFASGAFVTVDPDERERTFPATPSLHHIYPRAFLKKQREKDERLDGESVMNVCVISVRTNGRIGERNPVQYFKTYRKRPDYTAILASHLIPSSFVERKSFNGQDYPAFLAERAHRFIERLGQELPGVRITRG
jgi:hypothetical protein